MQAANIHRIDAYAYLEAAAIIQLSCCIRQGLTKEWDLEKVILLKANFNVPAYWKDRLVSTGMADAVKPGAVSKAISKLPAQYHEAVFLSCARIVGMKGYEQDMAILADLKEQMAIDDYRAEFIIDLIKAESEMYRFGGVL